jgi:hypothetical protein
MFSKKKSKKQPRPVSESVAQELSRMDLDEDEEVFLVAREEKKLKGADRAAWQALNREILPDDSLVDQKAEELLEGLAKILSDKVGKALALKLASGSGIKW